MALTLKGLATERAKEFQDRSQPTAFARIDRAAVATGIIARVEAPYLINQGDSSPSCGPAAFLFSVAMHRPDLYARFAIDLFEKGEAQIYNLKIKASKAVRNSIPPHDMDAVDWVTMASIRNSQNGWMRYSDMSDIEKFNNAQGFLRNVYRASRAANELLSGITMPRELAQWYKRSGYTEVVNCTSLLRDRSWADAERATQYLYDDYQVSLFVNAHMLYADEMKRGSLTPNHWIGLTSGIYLGAGDAVFFKVFTWGEDERPVPKYGQLRKKDFLDNFYGFVAARM